MTKIICSNCQRYYESDVVMANRSATSHTICARCNFLHFNDLSDDQELVDETKKLILEEQKYEWQGEDKSNFKPELVEKYNDLLRGMGLSSEMGIDKR